jgi:2-oxoisovalerate dehydrogenase E2 component (dihydrolipoyl transacylase)
MKKAMTKTMT